MKFTNDLSGSNGIYYARGQIEGARLYFKYSGDNIIVLGESNKPTQDAVIEFLLKNFKLGAINVN